MLEQAKEEGYNQGKTEFDRERTKKTNEDNESLSAYLLRELKAAEPYPGDAKNEFAAPNFSHDKDSTDQAPHDSNLQPERTDRPSAPLEPEWWTKKRTS